MHGKLTTDGIFSLVAIIFFFFLHDMHYFFFFFFFFFCEKFFFFFFFFLYFKILFFFYFMFYVNCFNSICKTSSASKKKNSITKPSILPLMIKSLCFFYIWILLPYFTILKIISLLTSSIECYSNT